MTIVTPDQHRFRRLADLRPYVIPVVRELPSAQTPGLAPGSW